MLELIITAMLPVTLTLVLGYVAGWHHDFNAEQAGVLNRMVLLYALPMLLVAGIVGTPIDTLLASVTIFRWLAIGLLGSFALVYVIARWRGAAPDLAVLRALAIGGPSVGFIGPVVLGAIDPTEADLAIAASSFLINLVQIPVVILILAGRDAPRQSHPLRALGQRLLTTLSQPIIWAPLAALGLVLARIELPETVINSLLLLGHATGGVALFAVGTVLYTQSLAVNRAVVANVVARNLLVPGLALIAMLVTGVPAMDRGIVAMTLAIPVSSITVIFAVQYKVGEQEMAATLGWSIITSVLSLALFIWLTAS